MWQYIDLGHVWAVISKYIYYRFFSREIFFWGNALFACFRRNQTCLEKSFHRKSFWTQILESNFRPTLLSRWKFVITSTWKEAVQNEICRKYSFIRNFVKKNAIRSRGTGTAEMPNFTWNISEYKFPRTQLFIDFLDESIVSECGWA